MCLHPKESDEIDASKITDELNALTNDYDTLNEFANSCRYIDHISELVPGDMDLTLLHLNIRSILNKQDELKNLLSSNDIDICSLNETWLDNTTKNQVQVSGYVLESSEHKNKSGGGVGILVGDHLKYKRRLDLENFDLELCIVEILGKNGNLIVCSLYRAPNTKENVFLREYRKLLQCISDFEGRHTILCMDHNFDLLKSDTHKKMEVSGPIPTMHTGLNV